MKAESVFFWRTAITSSDLPSTTRLVLLALSLYMNNEGQNAYPSQKRLAADCGLSDRSVRDQLARAESAGYLVKRKLKHPGSEHVFTTYVPLVPEPSGEPGEEPCSEGAEGRSGSEGGSGAEPHSGKAEGGSGIEEAGSNAEGGSGRNVVPVGAEGGSGGGGTSFRLGRNEVPTNYPINSSSNSSENSPVAREGVAGGESGDQFALEAEDEKPKPKKRSMKLDASGRPVYDEDFESVWRLFVNGGNKKTAYTAFLKINPDSELIKEMQLALMNYAGLHEKAAATPGAFLPIQKNGQGWFNQRDWETRFQIDYSRCRTPAGEPDIGGKVKTQDQMQNYMAELQKRLTGGDSIPGEVVAEQQAAIGQQR